MGIKHKRVVTHGQKGEAVDWNDDHEIDGDVECDQHQHIEHVIENRTTWPAGPVEGQIIYRTDVNIFYIWNGASWDFLNIPEIRVSTAFDIVSTTAGIQEAIDDLPVTGGVVFVPPGTHTITTTITMAQYVTLYGQGVESTKIVLSGATSVNMLVLDDNTEVRGIWFDGDGLTQAAGNIIQMSNKTDVLIHRCRFQDAFAHGILAVIGANLQILHNRFSGSGSNDISSAIGSPISNSIISDNISEDATDDFFGGIASNNLISNNHIVRPGVRGIGASGTSNIISNNYIEDAGENAIICSSTANVIKGNRIINPTDCGIYINSGDYNNVVSNNILNCGSHAIRINTDFNTITANVIEDVAAANDGIHFENNVIRNVVSANTIDGSGTMLNGVAETAGCNFNEIIGNNIDNYTNAGVVIVGGGSGNDHNIV